MKTLLLGAVTAALLHITPTVVLLKREQAVARLLPGADEFAARELHLSSTDSKRLHDAVGWEPPDGVVTFYLGKKQDRVTGVLQFMRVDCQHGPIELAIGYDPVEFNYEDWVRRDLPVIHVDSVPADLDSEHDLAGEAVGDIGRTLRHLAAMPPPEHERDLAAIPPHRARLRAALTPAGPVRTPRYISTARSHRARSRRPARSAWRGRRAAAG